VLTTWLDKSGNGRNAVGTGSPLFSNNSVVLNGSTQYYTIPYAGVHSTETGFIVVNFTSIRNTGVTTIVIGNVASTREVGLTSGSGYYIANAGVTLLASGPAVYAGQTYILDYSYNDSTSLVYINGVTAATSTSFTAVAESNLTLGVYNTLNSGYLQATVSEVLIYNTVLSTAQRQQVENYLGLKWGILPVTSGLQLWLDAADPAGNGTVPANGSNIPTWVDKSGNGYNAARNGSNSYTTNSLNGLGGMTLSGNIGFGNSPNFFTATTPTDIFTQALTMFIVYVNSGTQTQYTGLLARQDTLSTNNGNPFQMYYTNTTSILKLITSQYDAITFSNSYNIFQTTPTLLNITLNQTAQTMTMSANGSNYPLGGGGSWTPVDSGTRITIGGRMDSNITFNGTLYEVLVYNTVLPQQQVNSIQSYLAKKWNISMTSSFSNMYSSSILSNATPLPTPSYSNPPITQPSMNLGYLQVPSAGQGNPGTSTLYYDGTNWSLN